MYLLDINILIALADPDHEHHDKAESFFVANHQRGWATCPITENGFVRIISTPSYPNGPGSTDAACTVLKQLCAYDGHRFWPDDLSLRSATALPVSKHLTDHYLLNLAMHRQGKLVTMDRHIQANLIPGGADAYVVI
jgi:toxin-antitoxin system PIN domain toxin